MQKVARSGYRWQVAVDCPHSSRQLPASSPGTLKRVGADTATLGVLDGSVGLRIVRNYFVRDTVIEVTARLHPASRFSYSMSFQFTHATN